MAEYSFQEVMKQMNRMCNAQNCSDNDCPMFDSCGNIGAYCSNPKQAVRIEKIVMSWAAEHPEPVYPTWTEYFRMIGLFPAWSGHEILDHTPIPADTAKQIGVEPKEG